MERKTLLRPLLIGTIAAGLAFLIHQQRWVEILELKTLDLRFQIRGVLSPRAPIILVSIDQDSFDELGLPWPWPRTLHAELIRKLVMGQARIIGLDILFVEPKADPREDQALAQAIKEAGNVVLAAEYTEVPSAFGPKTGLSLPLPSIREHALGYGLVNMLTDRDGIVRRAELGLPFQDRIFPTFGYQIYRKMVGERAPREARNSGAPYFINFRGPARTYPVVPYYRILRGEVEPSLFRNKIVLVGAFSPSLHDVYPSPFSASQATPGVEIQANFIETLMANDSIIPFPEWGHSVIFFLLSGCTMLASAFFKPLRAFGAVVALASAYTLAVLYFFGHHHLWLPLIPPLLGMVLSYGALTLDNYMREQRERLRVRATFAKYVSPDVVEEILQDRAGLGLAGKRRHITVLFSDIRGFTSISEQIAPEQVVTLLSDYLAQVTHIVFKHGGTIDKFIGDAVMAIFGAPKSHEDDALRAVKAGLEMMELAQSLSQGWAKITGRPLRIGVGINSGDAVVGSIGSEIRSDFTAIGDTVNLAARLEALTKDLGVPMLISEFTVAEMKGSVPLKLLRQVKVTGRDAALTVYAPEAVLTDQVGFPAGTAEPFIQKSK